MKLLSLFTLLYMVMMGCTGNNAQLSKLQSIDSLMDQNPQAAYDSLRLYKRQMMEGSPRKVVMRYRLLAAKAQNKLYLGMPNDSVFQEVVDYYDSKGTSNEKMEAYYLMGCVYRDLHEAPKAMMSYKTAVECADTLSKGCDYTTLFRVYGQMADIYRYQYLHKEAIKCEQKYGYYAARVKNIASFIQSFDFIASEYYALGDTLKAIEQVKKCYMLYRKHGMYKDAAGVLPTLIYVCLLRAQYQQAHFYMDSYEKESGLFDRSGDIQEGHEHYYKAKGKYFQGVNQIDSAEYYYRKLGRYGFKFETAQGLLSVYRMRLNSDSIKKYSILCEQEMDNILNSTQADAVVQAASLYDYTRLQHVVDEERLHKERNKYVAAFVVLGGLFVLGTLVRRHRRIKKQMAEDLDEVNKDYAMTCNKMKKVCDELEMLQVDKDAFVRQKQEEVALLQTTLQDYKDKYEQLDLIDKNKELLATDVVVRFKEMAKPRRNGKKPNEYDWQELYENFQKSLPLLFEKVRTSRLSPQELQVCILVYLGMDNTEVAVLINTTTKTINNAKLKANYKLFGEKSASSLYDNLRKI